MLIKNKNRKIREILKKSLIKKDRLIQYCKRRLGKFFGCCWFHIFSKRTVHLLLCTHAFTPVQINLHSCVHTPPPPCIYTFILVYTHLHCCAHTSSFLDTHASTLKPIHLHSCVHTPPLPSTYIFILCRYTSTPVHIHLQSCTHTL